MTPAVEEAKRKSRLVFTTDQKSPEYPLNIGGIDPVVVGVGSDARIDYEQTIKHYNTIIKGAKKAMTGTKRISFTKRSSGAREELYMKIVTFIFQKPKIIQDIEKMLYGKTLQNGDPVRRTLQYDLGKIKRASQDCIQCYKKGVWRITPGYSGTLDELMYTIKKHMYDRVEAKAKSDKPSRKTGKTHIISVADLEPVPAKRHDERAFVIDFVSKQIVINDFSTAVNIYLKAFEGSEVTIRITPIGKI